jgi:hypothetical protein
LNSRIAPIVRKEILHILRNRRTLSIMLGLPLVELLFFGYAVTTGIKRLPLAVLDQDRSVRVAFIIDGSDPTVASTSIPEMKPKTRHARRHESPGG